MPNRAKFTATVPILLLGAAFPSCAAQSLETSLDTFLAPNLTVASKSATRPPQLSTIDDWSAQDPGGTVESPRRNSQYAVPQDPRSTQEHQLEGRWCLRSTAKIDLGEGVTVRRDALFYQPHVEQIFDKPLPPLPVESGDALRRHGCRLTRILSEFELPGGMSPRDFAETLARRLPGHRFEGPRRFGTSPSPDDFWKPLYSFSSPRNSFLVFAHDLADHPAVLLEWESNAPDYREPSSDTINPEAGQPWLPLRAALIARLPERPTLEMLSFLAPQVGDPAEQPALYCNRDLVPVLRNWFALAVKVTPERHAAALLVADAVANRLENCDEFSDSDDTFPPPPGMSPVGSAEDLRKSLVELGVTTDKSARPGPEFYSGNLIAQVRKLAPEGPVNELSWIVTLDERCPPLVDLDMGCTDFIKSGESLLSRFPSDQWTPSVHLLLAETYSITAAQEESYLPNASTEKARSLSKAAEHFRAWYATSTNDRDRALVWEEIWGIEAGLGPRLMVPWQLRQ
jgi:hypothetical protein